jgi:hypothetical protein
MYSIAQLHNRIPTFQASWVKYSYCWKLEFQTNSIWIIRWIHYSPEVSLPAISQPPPPFRSLQRIWSPYAFPWTLIVAPHIKFILWYLRFSRNGYEEYYLLGCEAVLCGRSILALKMKATLFSFETRKWAFLRQFNMLTFCIILLFISILLRLGSRVPADSQNTPANMCILFFSVRVQTIHREHKKFCEELIVYFPWYHTGRIANESKNSSAVVFVTSVTFLLCRCLAREMRFLRSRCLSTRGGYTRRHTDWWEGFMKYAVEMGTGATTHIPSFIKIGLAIQNWLGGIHRQTAWR